MFQNAIDKMKKFAHGGTNNDHRRLAFGFETAGGWFDDGITASQAGVVRRVLTRRFH